MKKVNLEVTKLEAKVLTALADEMYAEYGFSDVGPTEIQEKTGIEMKILRGVLSSLIQKKLIETDRREDEGYKNNIKMWICYLRGDADGLVEIWRDDTQLETTLLIKEAV